MRNRLLCLALLLGAFPGAGARAQSTSASGSSAPGLHGVVLDGVGRAIAGASIQLTDSRTGRVVSATSDAQGEFEIELPMGTYALQVTKSSFAAYTSIVEQTAGVPAPLRVTLDLAPMQQDQIVTATGVPTPQTQLGQSVEVADRAAIAARAGLTADDVLQEMTDVQVVRDGAVGGATDVMLRGGDPSFVKILLDGVPLQRFDYSSFDFSTLTPEALDSITVVRGADSVIYGSDAASGVIDMRSRTGAGVAGPQLTLDTMAGSFDTVQQSSQLLGSWRPLDYAFTFGYLDTHNQVPNNKAWNQSWSGNVGLRLPARSHVRLSLRHTNSRAGDPNAYGLYGIADDSLQDQGETYVSLAAEQQTTSHWTNSLTLSQSAVNYFFETVAPTGEPYGGNYLGLPVTIVGANGFSASGQAILDYGGTPFPQPFASDTLGRYASAESTYTFSPQWTLVAGYRYGDELGVTAPTTHWHDNGGFAELSGGRWNRVFGSAGVSEDSHSRFGNTLNPQASLAVLPRLQRAGWWNEIRLHANAATAQKDPTIAEDQSSLYQDALLSGGAALASSLHVGPILPQRARTFDAGVDQYLAGDRVRASLTWFDDRYYNAIEFVPYTALGGLGISNAVAETAQAAGGAYLNSLTDSSKGVEMDVDSRWRNGWHLDVAYTYLVPLVLQSYSSDALYPSYNPAYPNIPIGAFSPLVGARPFHVAPESGRIVAGYQRRRWQVDGNAYASSRRDDSTFLYDGDYGDTLLLPNHDLAPAYTAIDVSGFYNLNARVTLEGVMENLLNQDYQQDFGYPSLGRAVRVGVRLTLTKPEGH